MGQFILRYRPEGPDEAAGGKYPDGVPAEERETGEYHGATRSEGLQDRKRAEADRSDQDL